MVRGFRFMLASAALVALCAIKPGYSESTEEIEPITNCPGEKKANTNAILKEFGAKLMIKASTSYSGFGTEKLLDGNEKTSWFSASNDFAMKEKKTWIRVSFPAASDVKRVTALGNREPSWPKNYSVLVARVELLDKDGDVLASLDVEGSEKEAYDLDAIFENPVKNVWSVRITSLKDEGTLNGSRDVAIAEIQVE